MLFQTASPGTKQGPALSSIVSHLQRTCRQAAHVQVITVKRDGSWGHAGRRYGRDTEREEPSRTRAACSSFCTAGRCHAAGDPWPKMLLRPNDTGFTR